jgi:hypothetical protein
MPKNNAQSWALISLFIAILGVGMIAAGILLDDYNYFWMVMAGLLLSITFIICCFMFSKQARRLSSMFRRENLLAHWVLNVEEHLRKAEEEYRLRKSGNRKLLLLVTVLFVIIGGLFVLFGFDDWDDAVVFILIILGAMAVIAFAALSAPGMAYRKMKKSAPEIFIGTDGAWVMGEFVMWKAPMTRLAEVGYFFGEEGPVISVEYDIRQRYGYQRHTLRIPVAAGLEEQAFFTAQRIAGANGVVFRQA